MADVIKKGLIHVTDDNGNQVDVHPETEISQVIGLSTALNAKANISDIPTKTSQLTNNSGFITKAVTDLTNYYKKADTYTKTEVNDLISAIPKFSIKVEDALPTSNISITTIYLIKTANETGNLYTEYIYVNNKWEELGTQELDLSGYATTTWTTDQINNAKQELTEAISGSGSDLTEIINTKADKEHTHDSEDIIALPGYSKSSSVSPITVSDTLNIALGKLEKALDSKQPVGNYLLDTGTAERATSDANGNVINTTYATKEELETKLDNNSSDFIKDISISGTSIIVTKGDDTTDTLTTQDTTYSNATVSELEIGISEDGKLISAKVLKEFVNNEIINGSNSGVHSITSGTENGTISVDGNDVQITGLGSAAFADASNYASSNHTHTSNDINSMADYAIADVAEPIDETDTLNQAIGKLEKGLSEKLDVASIPTKVSDLENDAGYLSNISWNNIDDKPNSFIPSDHNHPSNSITEMTGYTKGNISGNISINDTLNQAIAKLENGLDTKANTTDIPDVSNFVSQLELAQGLSGKANTTDIPDVSNFITEVSWDDIKNKPVDFEPKSHTHDVVNASTNGFMSSTDKIKLDSIEEQVQSNWDELDDTQKSFIKNKPFGYINETRSNVDLIENVEYSKPPLANGVYTYDVTSVIDFSGIKSDILYYCGENSPLELPLQFALTALDTNHNANVPSANIMLQLPLTVEYFSENGVSGYRGSTPMQNNRAEFEFETDSTMNTVNYARILVSSSAGRLASYYAVYLDINEYNISTLVKIPIKFIPDQPSSIITSMDGYTKAINTSPITSNDTLNEAIGKLEKALDNVQESLPEMTAAEATAGTLTEARLISPKILNDKIDEKISSIPSIVVSDDADMPNTVKVEDFWIQLTGSSILYDANNFQF